MISAAKARPAQFLSSCSTPSDVDKMEGRDEADIESDLMRLDRFVLR